MKCLVTGVAGFVGSSLAERLLADGHEVVGVDSFIEYYSIEAKRNNLYNAISNPCFLLIEESLLNLNLVETLQGVDWVFHQAAQAGVRASWGRDFSTYTDNNILATQRLLEAAKNKEISNYLKKFIFASSSSVYGNAETIPTSENVLPQPVSPYGVTKLAAEHLVELYAVEFGLPTVSLRYFTVYGPRQRPDMAFHKFINAGLKNEEILVYGDGNQSRDFTFIDDIVEANILAAKAESKFRVYNIGGGSSITIRSALKLFSDTLGHPLNVKYLDRQAGDARHTSADTSLAERELGFSPKTPLEVGIKAQISWHQQEIY
jgi:nucleoside-diphosphate-sugar epimerase